MTEERNEQLSPEKISCQDDAFQRMALEVETAARSDAHLNLNDIILLMLETYQRGGGFDRVVFCLASSDRQQLIGRLGLGEGVESSAAPGRSKFLWWIPRTR